MSTRQTMILYSRYVTIIVEMIEIWSRVCGCTLNMTMSKVLLGHRLWFVERMGTEESKYELKDNGKGKKLI